MIPSLPSLVQRIIRDSVSFESKNFESSLELKMDTETYQFTSLSKDSVSLEFKNVGSSLELKMDTEKYQFTRLSNNFMETSVQLCLKLIF